MAEVSQPPSRRRRSSVGALEANTRDLPTTARGQRTRVALIAAARTVFERDGFLDARLLDITSEAGLSAGSFYTYFASKEEVFAAVLSEVAEEMLHPGVRKVAAGDDPIEAIRHATRAYLESYQRNARFMQLLEQVANIDEDFRMLRRRRAEAFTGRNARGIADLQARGISKAQVNPEMAASILSGMVGRAAYVSFVIGDGADLDELTETLTTLWANALLIDNESIDEEG